MAFVLQPHHASYPRTAPQPLIQTTQFTPYNDSENEGTILAVASAGFTVVAGDARLIEGRYAPKVFRLTDNSVLATTGFAADGNMFVKKVRQRLEFYRHAHAKDMSLAGIARLIQGMLYQRRFFPFYVHNILGGIEDDGSSAVYSFDSVGNYSRETARSAGTAAMRVQTFLESQISLKGPGPLPLSRALSLVRDAFAAGQTGPAFEIYVVLARGCSSQGLDSLSGVTELTGGGSGERMFVMRRGMGRD